MQKHKNIFITGGCNKNKHNAPGNNKQVVHH